MTQGRVLPLLQRTRLESGQRVVEQAEYRGCRLRVVAGYNILDDNFLAHLYVHVPGGGERRVLKPPIADVRLERALDRAFACGLSEVDALALDDERPWKQLVIRPDGASSH